MTWLKSPAWWGLALAALPLWLGLTLVWPPRWHPLSWVWLEVVLLYPVLEEIVFRLGVLGWLATRPWGQRQWRGVSFANFGATLVFVAAHFVSHPPAWALAVAVPSLVFGWSYQRWGVGAAIALHVWYNAGYFTLYPAGS